MSYYFALYLFEHLVINAWLSSIILGLTKKNLITWLDSDYLFIFLFILLSHNDFLILLLFHLELFIFFKIVDNLLLLLFFLQQRASWK